MSFVFCGSFDLNHVFLLVYTLLRSGLDMLSQNFQFSLSDVIIAIEYPSLLGSEIEIDCKNLKIKNEVRKRNLTSYEV